MRCSNVIVRRVYPAAVHESALKEPFEGTAIPQPALHAGTLAGARCFGSRRGGALIGADLAAGHVRQGVQATHSNRLATTAAGPVSPQFDSA